MPAAAGSCLRQLRRLFASPMPRRTLDWKVNQAVFYNSAAASLRLADASQLCLAPGNPNLTVGVEVHWLAFVRM